MNKYFKRYIGVVIAWIIMIIVSFSFMPRFNHLVNQNGDTRIPSSMSSKVASKIGSEFHKSGQDTRRLVVVFNSKTKMNSQQNINMSNTINKLKRSQKQLGIKSIITPIDSVSAQKQLIAKDQTTQLVVLNVDKNLPVQSTNAQIRSAVKTASLKTYVTSFSTIKRDTNRAAFDGIIKATIIIAIFVLLLLLVVFRSVIIPLISVLTTSVAYVISLWAIGSLNTSYGLPISRDTQAGMLLVLATLGTGYALLYFSGLKNQFAADKGDIEATLAIRKRFTQLVSTSSIVLAIAFGSLGFINYSLVQSFSGIGISIIILLAATLTFLPFFSFVLGKRVFLPAAKLTAHNYNKGWHFLATKSAKYPLIALVLAILVAIPFIVNSKGPVSFDPTREISTQSSSAKAGYKVIKTHFPEGVAEPVTVYIKANHTLDNDADLREIDRVTNQLTANKLVSAINSVTQPEGEPLQQLYMQEQLQIVTGSLDSNMSSLNRVAKGLKSTKINSRPLTRTDRSVTSIADRVSKIQEYNEMNNVTETPSEIVAQVQSELQQTDHKRMNRFQRSVVREALKRAMADQTQQDRVNNALNRITSQTDSASQTVSQFRMELAAIQAKIQGYGTQVRSSTKEVKQSRDFLNEMAKSPAGQTFYIPEDV
ncbi:MMPL family transporter [Lentilactobacillus kosonis]|uniref:Membrane protein n=1 Tax=Lentilactobacillus kosonis TaxID=2810561 RepID=A0A401FMX3_9LACO|nr:MMPL family transporter [Lentilactobacillus kosonis]GAY73581.1 membrane protein [Lentilactobacillus kosonis]